MQNLRRCIPIALALLAGCASPPPVPVAADAPEKVAPAYQLESKRPGEQGTVRLQVLADESGKPVKLYVLKSSGFPSLDQQALDTVRNWRFAPAKLKGKPIAEWVLVPIRFVNKP